MLIVSVRPDIKMSTWCTPTCAHETGRKQISYVQSKFETQVGVVEENQSCFQWCRDEGESVLALSGRRSGAAPLWLIKTGLSVNLLIHKACLNWAVFFFSLKGWEGWVSANVGQPCDWVTQIPTDTQKKEQRERGLASSKLPSTAWIRLVTIL